MITASEVSKKPGAVHLARPVQLPSASAWLTRWLSFTHAWWSGPLRRRVSGAKPSQRWQAFLANHRNEIWAADFFTVPTVLFQTLYVLFFISHDRRRIEHINVTAHPNTAWVWRQVIEATPWGRGPRFLIRDRDRSYGGDFIAKARAIGIETVLTPIRAPQANGIAERLIGTLRRDCTNHVIPLSERHLRRVLLEYVAYYNATRPHQTLGQETPQGPREARLAGMVRGEEVLGGIHHRYERVAA